MAVYLNREAIVAALADAKGNVSVAARALDVSRRTLQNHMRAHAMPPGKTGRPKRKLRYRRGLGAGALAALGAVAAAGVLVVRHRFGSSS